MGGNAGWTGSQPDHGIEGVGQSQTGAALSHPHTTKRPAPSAIGGMAGAQRARWSLGNMVGRSPAMERLFLQMRYLAGHLRVALVEGERGYRQGSACSHPARARPAAAWPAAARLAAARTGDLPGPGLLRGQSDGGAAGSRTRRDSLPVRGRPFGCGRAGASAASAGLDARAVQRQCQYWYWYWCWCWNWCRRVCGRAQARNGPCRAAAATCFAQRCFAQRCFP